MQNNTISHPGNQQSDIGPLEYFLQLKRSEHWADLIAGRLPKVQGQELRRYASKQVVAGLQKIPGRYLAGR
jgi:hypothetical protein